MATDHSPPDSLQLPKRFADLWSSQSPSAAPDLIPTPVAGTPSASKSPHPDRSDPDRAESGHCRLPRISLRRTDLPRTVLGTLSPYTAGRLRPVARVGSASRAPRTCSVPAGLGVAKG